MKKNKYVTPGGQDPALLAARAHAAVQEEVLGGGVGGAQSRRGGAARRTRHDALAPPARAARDRAGARQLHEPVGAVLCAFENCV